MLENQARDLRGSLVGSADAAYRAKVEARDAKAAGDRLYWPIYNLDPSARTLTLASFRVGLLSDRQ